jgi:hypothetical protein
VVVSPAHRLGGLGEQRGEDDPSDSRQGSQDRHVALLGLLPRQGLSLSLALGELGAEDIETAVRLLDLAADQLEASGNRSDVRARRLGGASRHRQRLLPQDPQCLGRRNPPDAVRLENALDAAFANPGGLGRRGRQSPQLKKPIGCQIVADRERLRVVAPQLLAHAVGEPIALLLQILGHARPLAQLNDNGVLGDNLAEAMAVGAHGIAEHMRIAPIVLRPGDSETVAEAIELFRVDRVDREPSFEQGRNNRAVRYLAAARQSGRAGGRSAALYAAWSGWRAVGLTSARPKIRALVEATFLAGLRKAGMPEE